MFKKRSMSRENLENLRGVAIMLEADGDKFGTYLQGFVEDMLTLRQAAFGGQREIRSKHWNQDGSA